jgi:hypothetical protein
MLSLLPFRPSPVEINRKPLTGNEGVFGEQISTIEAPALSNTLSQAAYAGGQVKTILGWDFHISPEDTCPKAIVT